MSPTSIEWTDETWNPVTGCTKVSAGCQHCYAETFAHRQMGPWKGRAFEDVRCHEERLDAPLHWRNPRRVFVNSMSDLFHPDVPDAFIDRVFAVMAQCPEHTFQVLTKRPERMRVFVSRWDPQDLAPLPLPNVWLGVSAEGQATLDTRWHHLRVTPAAIRFLSLEPLLEPVDFQTMYEYLDTETLVLPDWVVVGGESGPTARPCDVAWIRSIIRQCRAAGVPCFTKQLGARPTGWWSNALGPRIGRVKHPKGGDPAEWPEDLRVREMPERHAIGRDRSASVGGSESAQWLRSTYSRRSP